MTKRLTTYFLVSLMAFSLIFIFGCPNPEEPTNVGKPANLTISATTDGLGVKLEWDTVTDAEGYYVITPAGDSTADQTETYYEDIAPAQTGTYKVIAFIGNDESDPATVSDAPTTGTSVTLYKYDIQSTTPSAYGWDPTSGIGQTYEATSGNADVIDFYVDTDFTFTSPTLAGGSYQGNKTTGFYWGAGIDFSEAPETGYYGTQAIDVGYYAFYTEEHHYAKVHVTTEDGSTVTFDSEFQTITNLRIF